MSAPVCWAQDAPPLNMTMVSEFKDPDERISGGAAVGVLFYEQGDKVDLDRLYVLFSQPVDTELTLYLTTVDGRYRAIFNRSADSDVPFSKWRQVKLPLSDHKLLSEYSINEIAMLMIDENRNRVFPLRWGSHERAGNVRIFVNTENANSYFAIRDSVSGKLRARNCETASARSSFRFDRLCDVPVRNVVLNNTVKIMRKRGADFGTPLIINVALTEEH